MQKKKRKLSQKEQSKQFIDKAKELGCDERGKSFENALNVITPPVTGKHPSKPKS